MVHQLDSGLGKNDLFLIQTVFSSSRHLKPGLILPFVEICCRRRLTLCLVCHIESPRVPVLASIFLESQWEWNWHRCVSKSSVSALPRALNKSLTRGKQNICLEFYQTQEQTDSLFFLILMPKNLAEVTYEALILLNRRIICTISQKDFGEILIYSISQKESFSCLQLCLTSF